MHEAVSCAPFRALLKAGSLSSEVLRLRAACGRKPQKHRQRVQHGSRGPSVRLLEQPWKLKGSQKHNSGVTSLPYWYLLPSFLHPCYLLRGLNSCCPVDSLSALLPRWHQRAATTIPLASEVLNNTRALGTFCEISTDPN